MYKYTNQFELKVIEFYRKNIILKKEKFTNNDKFVILLRKKVYCDIKYNRKI